MKPLIGVTPRYNRETNEVTMRRFYMDAILRAGGIPVLFPYDIEAAVELMQMLDGVVFVGGLDISPNCYSEDRQVVCGKTNYQHDRFDLKLCQHAIRSDIPLLAICRGMQLLNVALGGTLVQDLSGGVVAHKMEFYPDEYAHSVDIERNSQLYRVVGVGKLSVNSFHHQACQLIGDGLSVVGRAADDVVEAIELPGHRFCIGVQWHPEMLSDVASAALFKGFLQACNREGVA